MSEVDEVTQAEMAVKLSENVRELVRMHLRGALEDPSFMGSLINRFPLQNAVIGNPYDPTLVHAVVTIIKNQMNKL